MAFPGKVLRAFPVLLAVVAAGCAPGAAYLRPDYRPPASLAVLPFDNLTTDLDGPVVARFWVDQRLAAKKGYRTVPLDRIDETLRGMGITDGGQLAAVTPEALGRALGAEALVYGKLLEFGSTTTGFLNIRRVKARLTMIEAAAGERLWEGEGLGASAETAASAAGAARAAALSVGGLWAEKAAGSPLLAQTLDMVWNAVEFLPPARNR